MALRTVKADGSGDYTTFVAALAASGPGDIIEGQDSDTYIGCLIITISNLIIRAAAGCSPVIQNSGGWPLTIRISTASQVTLRGLAINGTAANASHVQTLGACTDIEIDSCSFGPTVATGYAIELASGAGPYYIHDCLFTGDRCAIYTSSATLNLHAEHCVSLGGQYGLLAQCFSGWVRRWTFAGETLIKSDPSVNPNYEAFEVSNCLALCTDHGMTFDTAGPTHTADPHVYDNTLIGDGGAGDNGIACTGTEDIATTIVRNNIVKDFGGTGYLGGGGGLVTHDHNCAFSCGAGWGGGLVQGPTDVAADPLFVGGGDYHLSSGSPCINPAGLATGATPDLDAVTRPLVGDPDDIGCYVWISPAPQVVSLSFLGTTLARVDFSIPMLNDAALLNPTNYPLTALGVGWPIVVTLITPEAMPNPTYVLLTITEGTDTEIYRVTVSNVRSAAGDLIDPAHNTADDAAIGVQPQVTGGTPLTPFSVEVQFDEPMHSVGAAGDWTVAPLGMGVPVNIVSISHSPGDSAVGIVVDVAMTTGIAYRFTCPLAAVDMGGNLVDPAMRIADITMPAYMALASVMVLGPNCLRATFNADFDPTTVKAASQWALSPVVPGASPSIVVGVTLESATQVLLDVIPAMAPGTAYLLEALTATGAMGEWCYPDSVQFTSGHFDEEGIGPPPSEAFLDVPVSGDVYPGTPGRSRIYPMLQSGLRRLDHEQGGDLLDRFLARPDELWATLEQKIHRLPYLFDPVRCPTECLDFLRSHVAFGAGAGTPDEVASRLSSDDLRRLISVAVRYWKTRGLRVALSDMIRVFTSGIRPAIDDWFFVRTLVDEGLLGVEGGPGIDPWLVYSSLFDVPGGLLDGAEHEVSFRVPDLGTLDRTVVLDLCSLARIPSERFEVAFVDFLDLFVDGRTGYWSSTPHLGLTAVWREGDGDSNPAILPGMTFPPGAAERVETPQSHAWTEYIWSAVMDWSATHLTTMRFYWQDPTHHYFADFTSATGTVRIGKRDGAVTTILATGLTDLSVPAVRGVRIECINAPVGRQIRVYVDGELAVEHSGDTRYDEGTIEVELDVTTPTRALTLCRTELYRVPLTIEHLGP